MSCGRTHLRTGCAREILPANRLLMAAAARSAAVDGYLFAFASRRCGKQGSKLSCCAAEAAAVRKDADKQGALLDGHRVAAPCCGRPGMQCAVERKAQPLSREGRPPVHLPTSMCGLVRACVWKEACVDAKKRRDKYQGRRPPFRRPWATKPRRDRCSKGLRHRS